ncbi:hypothetical protein RND81_08G142700 [Saponaria officinalis]|uniref:Malic enzyme N-terminal domain-containing protein n=1 Tax=Saponaria officinalis TaxID=3572 RepID=A0AAW1J6M3_SAPOF
MEEDVGEKALHMLNRSIKIYLLVTVAVGSLQIAVDMIVVTDGSRILGLGDLGVHGIDIPIGKLDIYVADVGMNPERVLPVMLNVGTNNQKLLEDCLYFGLRQPRLEGDDYLAIVDEFMEAIHTCWPEAII